MKSTFLRSLKLSAAPMVMTGALLSTAAFAQTTPTTTTDIAGAPADQGAPAPQEIVVTGTRILSPNIKSIAPVTSSTADDIKASGITKVEDFLNQLPQVFAAQSSTLSNGATGTAQVNLRDLGADRTLVLINGRRLMPGDPRSSAADLNFIPSSLIKRVDVLTGGASATYGADAVAGVVNFIIDKDFTGFRADINNGFYFHNNGNTFADGVLNSSIAAGRTGYNYLKGDTVDGDNFDGTISYGAKFADGRGHAMAYFGYRKSGAITQNLRDYSTCSLTSATACGGSGTSAAGNAYYYTPESGTGSVVGALGKGTLTTGSATRYNYAPTNYYQRPDQRFTAGAFVDYDGGEKFHPYLELMFMADHSRAQIAPSGDFGNTLTINCSNPLLTAQEKATLCTTANTVIGYLGTFPVTNGFTPNLSAAQLASLTPATAGTAYFQLLKRNVEGGARVDDLHHKQYRGVIGADGDLGHSWHYGAYYQYGQVNYNETYINDVSITNLTYALNDCVNAPAACVPYDVFSGNGVSQAAISYITGTGTEKAKNVEQVADASISGDLGTYGIKSPFSENGVQISIGGEFRRESEVFTPNSEFTTGDLAGQGGATLPIKGAFNVYEAIGELDVPIFGNSVGDILVFNGGARFSHYQYHGTEYDASYDVVSTSSPSFNTFTYKLGLTLQPTKDIMFRGSLNRAVRAPNLVDAFQSDQVVLDGSTDPCAGFAITAADKGCIAQGLKVNQTVATNIAGQYNGLTGGNTALTPEVAITKSLGVVFTPHGLRGTSLSVDYFDINIKNAIQTIGADAILAACVSAPTSGICSLVHRSASGSLYQTTDGYVIDTEQNIGGVDTRGFDFNLVSNHRVGHVGAITATFDGTLLDRYVVNNGVTASYDCAGYYGVSCGVPLPTWRHKARLAFNAENGLGVSVTWRYVGPVDVDYKNPSATLNSPGYATYGSHIDGQSYFDAVVTERFGKSLTARLGVNNIFDKDPPLVITSECQATYCNGNTYPGTYDPLGRYLYGSATLTF